MNKVLEENLKFLSIHGINIDKNFSTEKVSFIQDSKGIDVPVLNVNGSKHVYSTVDAVESAKVQISNLKIMSANVLIVFGSGLLYDVYEIISKWKEKGYVFIIEPDEDIFKQNILRTKLSLDTNVAHMRFYVGKEITEENIITYITNELGMTCFYPTLFYGNIAYEKAFFDEYLKTARAVKEVATRYGVLYNTYGKFHKDYLYHIGKGIPIFYEKGASLNPLKNLYKGKPAVVVATGPSLKKNVELLKEVQDKVVIIAPLVALKVIEPLGIKPDFVISVDPTQQEEPHHKDLDNYEFNMVLDSAGNVNLLKKNTGNNFMFLSNNNLNFEPYFRNHDFENVNIPTGGSVANNATGLAQHLGCNRIILLGQDLSFKGSSIHAYEDSKEHVDLYKKFKILKVKGFYGEEVETNNVFEVYKSWFELFAKENKEYIHCINATEGGSYIEHFDHMSFREAIDQYLTESFDTVIPEDKVVKPSKEDFEAVYKTIEEEIEFYKENLVKLREVMRPIKKILKAFEKNQNADITPFAKDLKKLDKFDKFYKENQDKYQYCKTMQYASYMQQQRGYPLSYSSDRIVAENNHRFYAELLLGIEMGLENLEYAYEELTKLKEERYGIQ